MGNIKDGSAVFIVRKIGLLYGTIMAFSGTFDSNGYPIDTDTNAGDTGWHICDGTKGTPDLRGKFILGASSSHAVGSTGGEESHVLTVEEMPSHNHTITFDSVGDGQAGGDTWYYDIGSAGENISSRTPTNHTGGNQPHNNMPPYYTLSYIMKL